MTNCFFLTAFDIKNAATTRLIKQVWDYDALGCKGYAGAGGARYLNVTSGYGISGMFDQLFFLATRPVMSKDEPWPDQHASSCPEPRTT